MSLSRIDLIFGTLKIPLSFSRSLWDPFLFQILVIVEKLNIDGYVLLFFVRLKNLRRDSFKALPPFLKSSQVWPCVSLALWFFKVFNAASRSVKVQSFDSSSFASSKFMSNKYDFKVTLFDLKFSIEVDCLSACNFHQIWRLIFYSIIIEKIF